MSMRIRYDENGQIKGSHNMLFDEVPDDFIMRTVLLDKQNKDLSYTAFLKGLREAQIEKAFEDNNVYSKRVISHLALDYLYSAIFLHEGIVVDRSIYAVSPYIIPCAYMCKHSVELKLKECILEKYGSIKPSHSVAKLWEALNEQEVVHYKEISHFIHEIEAIDGNEIALRYGVSAKLEPLQEDFMFDIDALLDNAKFFFNVVDEYIVCKYRYKPEEK